VVCQTGRALSSHEVEWATGAYALERAGAEWDALADRHPDPFMQRDWLGPWSRAFGTPQRRELCLVWRDGSLVAAAPFLRSGARLEAMANLHTPVFRPMARDAAALDALAQAIGRADAGALTLGPLADEPATARLVAGSRRARRLVAVETLYVSPVAETADGDYEKYRHSRGSSWKSLEQKVRRAARQRAVELRLLCSGEDGLAFLEEGLQLEATGWKGKAGTAMLSAPHTARFYREMCTAFAGRNEVGLSGMWLDGTLVAFDLGLLFGGRFWGLKAAYDEQHRKLSPSLLLARATVEESFRRRLLALEMLGSTEPYKELFATTHRRHLTCRAFRLGPRWAPVWAWRRARPYAKRVFRRAVARSRR
jgi:CelD/BcsL family acetyltransferase involved in cellulose biosynthesis